MAETSGKGRKDPSRIVVLQRGRAWQEERIRELYEEGEREEFVAPPNFVKPDREEEYDLSGELVELFWEMGVDD